MSVKSAPYYWVECDVCETNLTEHGEHAAWAQRDYAVTEVADYDGFAYSVRDEREIIICGKCYGRYLACLSDEEGEELVEDDPLALAALGAWIDSCRAEGVGDEGDRER